MNSRYYRDQSGKLLWYVFFSSNNSEVYDTSFPHAENVIVIFLHMRSQRILNFNTYVLFVAYYHFSMSLRCSHLSGGPAQNCRSGSP